MRVAFSLLRPDGPRPQKEKGDQVEPKPTTAKPGARRCPWMCAQSPQNTMMMAMSCPKRGTENRQQEIVKRERNSEEALLCSAVVIFPLFVLLRLRALDLGRAAQRLLPVLALFACGVEKRGSACLPDGGAGQGLGADTHAVVCWPCRPWWPCRCGPACSGARTSGEPRASRRSGRSRWSCRHRTGCAGRTR